MALSNNVTIQIKRGLKENLPTSAPQGELLFCTDTSELFVGTGTGIAQVGGGTTTVIPFSTASTTWNVLHNLGKRPSVTAVDTSGNAIGGQIVYNSDNQITIYYSLAVAGTVYLN